MTFDPATVIAILAMAGATYLTRISGFLLGPLLPHHGRLRQALDAVPTALLTAVVAPSIMSGRAEFIAAIATILTARRYPALVAIGVGVGVVFIGRNLLSS